MMRGRRLITRGKNSNNKNDNKAETIYISAVQCQKILIKRNKKSKRGGIRDKERKKGKRGKEGGGRGGGRESRKEGLE